jgi:hypothetical protein
MTNAARNIPIETTYIYCPQGFMRQGKIIKLLRALYGLRQSPLLWHKNLSKALRDFGFTEVPGISCLFSDGKILVFFFVDDIVSIGYPRYEREMEAFERQICSRYEMKCLGEPQWFLGIRIIRNRETRRIWLCQDSFMEKIASKFIPKHRQGKPRPSTPLPATFQRARYEGQASENMTYRYQQRVGSVNYPAVVTRPDVAKAASLLSEHLQNPAPSHLEAADHCIEYLHGTRYLGIEYNGEDISNRTDLFLASANAAFGDDPNTRHSSDGYHIQLFGGAIDWTASKQRTVTLSTTEAELLSLSNAGKEVIWWERFFKHIRLDLDHKSVINCDNQQTVGLVNKETPKLVTKLRHVDIHQHWLRQEVQHGNIAVTWMRTSEIPADGFTKRLTAQQQENFVKHLGLSDISGML